MTASIPDKLVLWGVDNYHPGLYGAYLSALVLFGQITGVDPRTLGWEQAAQDLGISQADALRLEQVAYEQIVAGAVPEPGTWAWLAAALIGGVVWRARRVRQRAAAAAPRASSVAVALGMWLAAVAGLCWTFAPSASAAAFTAGDLVVYTIDNTTAAGGNGNALSSRATPVRLLEYNTTAAAQSPVQAIPLNLTGASALSASGTAASDGALHRSADGTVLTFGGYNSPVGPSTGVTGTVSRIFATVNPAGTVAYSSPFFASGDNMRAVVSAGAGSGYYIATSAGLGYTPSLTGAVNAVTGAISTRDVNIFNGQLYTSASAAGNAIINGGVNTVGIGQPTGPAYSYLLPGLTSTANSQNNFRFFDLRGNDGTPDTLYVALGTVGGGIQRFTLDSATQQWSLAYTLNTAGAGTGFFGLTGRLDPTDSTRVELFATTQPGTSNAGGNALLSFTDSVIPNGSGTVVLTTANNDLVTLATAGSRQMFRGVDFAPQSASLGAGSIFAVPEPSTWCGLIFGGIGLAVARVARNRRDHGAPAAGTAL